MPPPYPLTLRYRGLMFTVRLSCISLPPLRFWHSRSRIPTPGLKNQCLAVERPPIRWCIRTYSDSAATWVCLVERLRTNWSDVQCAWNKWIPAGVTVNIYALFHALRALRLHTGGHLALDLHNACSPRLRLLRPRLSRCHLIQRKMPLWQIFSNPSTFTPDQKRALVESITPMYTKIGLPAFYVNVIFIPVESDCFYVGNQQVTKMVRIVIEHIAVHQPKEESDGRGLRAKLCTKIDEVRGAINGSVASGRKTWRVVLV